MRIRRIAILIDGGFFIKRLSRLVEPQFCDSAESVAESARMLCERHVQKLIRERWDHPHTLKKQVDTLILVTGDSDFVPAARLARREGVEFLLDPLWQQVNDDLHEHVDGVVSGFRRPGAVSLGQNPNPLAPAPDEE